MRVFRKSTIFQSHVQMTPYTTECVKKIYINNQMVFAPSYPTPSTRSDSPILCSKTFAPYFILFFSCLRVSICLLNESFSSCSASHNFLNSSATSVKCSIISFYKSVCSFACSYCMCVIAGRNICSSFSSMSDYTRI